MIVPRCQGARMLQGVNQGARMHNKMHRNQEFYLSIAVQSYDILMTEKNNRNEYNQNTTLYNFAQLNTTKYNFVLPSIPIIPTKRFYSNSTHFYYTVHSFAALPTVCGAYIYCLYRHFSQAY